MEGWKEYRLGDVFHFYNGKAIKVKEFGKYPVYGSNGVIGFSDIDLFDNSIIIGRVGAYCGAVFYEKNKFWASDNTIVVKSKNNFDIKYLAYHISLINLNWFAGGSAQPLLTHGWIKPIKIIIPPLPTQRKIAKILSAYDDLIENNLKRIKLLEEMAQITYEEWFVRMKFPGHENAVFDEETGLPEGWEKVKLGEVCKLTMGQSPKSEFYNTEKKGLPFHQGVKDYGDRFPTNTMWSTNGSRFAEKGTVLFSVRAPVGRLNIAIEKIILGRGLASISYKNNWNGFLYYQLKQLFFKDNLIGGGAIFNSVTKNDMLRIGLIEGDEKTMIRFNKIVEPIDMNIENLHKQNQRLKEARDILLPRLMTGIIDVEELEGV